MDGKRCPQFEHAPQTAAGRSAWDIASSGGCWAVGFGGVTGINWVNAQALSDAALWPLVLPYLRAIEAGALIGAARKAEQDREDKTHG